MPQLLVPVDDAAPETIRAAERLLHVDQHARWRQVFEQIRGALEEQRQIKLEPARRAARAHIAIDGLLGQVAGKSQAVAAPELAHRIGTHRRFPGRQQFDALELLPGSLGIGIEQADAVDVLIQKIDTERRIRSHGKDIEQRAADREFAVRDHLRDGGVSGEGEALAQGLEVEPLAHVDLQRVGLDVAARGEPLQQRVDRHDPYAAERPRQGRERFQARRGDIRMRREAVVGQGLEVRKNLDHGLAGGEKPDLLAQGLRIARTRHDDDQRPASFRRRLGDREGCRGPVELSPFDDRGGRGRERGI